MMTIGDVIEHPGVLIDPNAELPADTIILLSRKLPAFNLLITMNKKERSKFLIAVDCMNIITTFSYTKDVGEMVEDAIKSIIVAACNMVVQQASIEFVEYERAGNPVH